MKTIRNEKQMHDSASSFAPWPMCDGVDVLDTVIETKNKGDLPSTSRAQISLVTADFTRHSALGIQLWRWQVHAPLAGRSWPFLWVQGVWLLIWAECFPKTIPILSSRCSGPGNNPSVGKPTGRSSNNIEIEACGICITAFRILCAG